MGQLGFEFDLVCRRLVSRCISMVASCRRAFKVASMFGRSTATKLQVAGLLHAQPGLRFSCRAVPPLFRVLCGMSHLCY